MPDKSEQLSYELRIGVTGHRNLSNGSAVAEAVDKLVASIDQLIANPEDVPIEWCVISPLAKGSDRIVAKSILKKKNARLELLTPFPLDEYRKDFSDPEDLLEFNQLLQKADPPLTEPLEKNADQNNSKPRTRGYLPVGRKVVDACEILIAIWDGKPSRGKGGTAEIVSYALERGKTILRIDAENPKSPATLLRPTKKKNAVTNTPDYQELPLPDTAKKLSLNYHQFLEFCRDTSLSKEKEASLIKECVQDIRQQAKKSALPDAQLTPVLDYLIPTYVRANELSMIYQKQHVLLSKAIHILSAIAVSVVVFQVTFFPEQKEIIALEICAMVGVLVALMISRQFSWHGKWIDYRFLAEQLRTAIYTVVLELNPLSGPIHTTKTLPFYNKPKNWIDFSIDRQISKVLNHSDKPAHFSAVKQFVVEGWLDTQKTWHKNNAHKKKHAEHQLHTAVIVLFCVTLAMAILHILEPESQIPEGQEIFYLSEWGKFLAITLPAWGGALHAIGKQLEYDRVAERSNKMAGELDRLLTLANESTTPDELREIVQQAVQTINLETYEWWALISFNSPELVA